MEWKVPKSKLKNFSVDILNDIDLFQDLRPEEVKLKDNYVELKGNCVIRGIPFTYEVRVNGDQIEYLSFHVDLIKYYEKHPETDESTKELKYKLIAMDDKLFNRTFLKEED